MEWNRNGKKNREYKLAQFSTASTNILEYKHNTYFDNNTTLTQYKELLTKIFHSFSPVKNIIC